MNKSSNGRTGKRERSGLGFADAVSDRFAFLAELGFRKVESQETLVRYGKGNLEVVVYLGRQSFEIGFEVARFKTRYTLEELIRAADPEVAAHYRSFAATTPKGIAEGLARLERLVKQYGEWALLGDPEFFAALDQQRRAWAQQYEADVLAAQLRPKAEAAFRSGDYRQAAVLFERIRSRLGATELRKLALAKERSGL